MLSLIRKALMQLQAFVADEKGQAMTQTGLALSLVAIICLVAMTAIGLVVSGNLYDFAIAIDGRSSSLTLN